MTSNAFRLGTFAVGDRRFVGIVMDTTVLELSAIEAKLAPKQAALPSGPDGLLGLLQDWDRNFDSLRSLVDKLTSEGLANFAHATHALGDLRVLAPVSRPPKLLYSAQNYREHVAGMRKTFRDTLPAVDPAKDYQGDKATSQPYLFFKGSNCVTGAYDDIVLPSGADRIDWEAELAVVIGRPGRNIPASKSANHIAGYMTTNDISCRSRTWRTDRPNLRSDWMTGKSYDTFAPMGPFFVPAAFVPDPANLRIQCLVNGVTKQDGNSGDMIFSIGEQIAYASEIMTLESGDVFATGTPAGTGQERLEYLKAGDILETEIECLGRQRNKVVAGTDEYRDGR